MTIATDFMQPVLQNQEYNQREATLPAELAQKAASTRYTTALADRVETETAGERAVAAAMKAASGVPAQMGGSGSVADQLRGMAKLYTDAGMPSKAAEFLGKASQAEAHEATARAAAFREAAAKVKLKGDQFKMASNLLSGVTDEKSWNEANRLFQEQTGSESPFKNMPYDKPIVDTLKNASMSAYQKEQMKLKEAEFKERLVDDADKRQHRAASTGIALERLRVTQQREKRLEKAGGKDIGAPGKAEVQAADKLLGDTGLEGDERDAAAFSIASEAKVLRRKNPGISADEALRQAAITAKTNGSITPGEKNLFSKNVPTKFAAPVSMPASGKKADLVEGQLYKQGDKVARWTKGGWELVKGTPAKAAAPSGGGGGGGSDGEDPDGEDDE